MRRALIALVASPLLLLLAGCANRIQPPVSLAPLETGQRVGVALAQVPKASVETPGASCLVCVAAAQAANAGLARHVDTLDTGEFVRLRDELAAALRKKGASVTVIPDPVALDGLAELPGPGVKRDFRPLKEKYAIEKLVLVSVEALGITRSYWRYAPTSDPRVFIRTSGSMINLDANTYDWYLRANVFKPAEGSQWDQPPKYPGLTKAYDQALEESKARLLEPWSD